MFIIRWILGRVILLLNFIFSPKAYKRELNLQKSIDEQTASLALYQYNACPFCVKVRRQMRRQSLHIQTVDAKQEEYKRQLENQGGAIKVPCLRIEEKNKVTWLYESSAIIDYLKTRFTA
ncbi:glutaredoxin [Psychromonas sp. PRT-SC03]|nr:glutaredoxin [Psychromonas sp. PRT-SC03]